MKQNLLLAVLLFVTIATTHAQTTWYVDAARPNNTGAGTTWATAEKELQVAINEAVSGDQVWVKAGTYKPTTGADRTISFSMKNGVAIYGGFTGAETLLSQRNEIYNLTILSGDLLGNDIGFTNNGENSYNVFRNNGLNSTAVLDGFTVRGGNANLITVPGCYGGAMYNENAAPTIRNSLFLYNVATYGGGAIFTSAITITNCVFNNNSLLQNNYGIAIYARNASITNTVFTGNTKGVGVIFTEKSLSLYNCTIASNDGLSEGFGGVYAEFANVIVQNSVFSDNSYDLSGSLRDVWGVNSSVTVSYSTIVFGGVNNVGNDYF
jgi:trimeric autotransporter adhesin